MRDEHGKMLAFRIMRLLECAKVTDGAVKVTSVQERAEFGRIIESVCLDLGDNVSLHLSMTAPEGFERKT